MTPETRLFKISGPALIPKTLEEVKQAVTDKLAFVAKQVEALDK